MSQQSAVLDALHAADTDDPTVDAPEPGPASSSAPTALLANGLDEKGYAALRVPDLQPDFHPLASPLHTLS